MAPIGTDRSARLGCARAPWDSIGTAFKVNESLSPRAPPAALTAEFCNKNSKKKNRSRPIETVAAHGRSRDVIDTFGLTVFAITACDIEAAAAHDTRNVIRKMLHSTTANFLRTRHFRTRITGARRYFEDRPHVTGGGPRDRRPVRQPAQRDLHDRCHDHGGLLRDICRSDEFMASASVDLLGEILDSSGPRPRFQRGVTNYPAIDDLVGPDHQSGAPHHLCTQRIGPDQRRHAAAGSVRQSLCRRRGNAQQAFRRARLDRRRQVERRFAAAQ